MIKLISKGNSRGINRHSHWVYIDDITGKAGGIDHNHNVCGAGYYLFEAEINGSFSTGEGCDTVWYNSLKSARAMLKKYLTGEISTVPNGHDPQICNLCKGHYSYNSPGYKAAPSEHACKGWKEEITRTGKILP